MKVLIVSHHPISTTSNIGKTMSSLFKSFRKQELAQLYCYPSFTDVDKCNSFFKITDIDVLKSILPPFKLSSCEVKTDDIVSSVKSISVGKYTTVYRAKEEYKRLLREVIWKLARWYDIKLTEWLKREKPDYIFAAVGNACFLYDMVLKISKNNNIPIVAYICDDYYFIKDKENFFGKLRYYFVKKKIEQLMKAVQKVVFISEELKNIYTHSFGINGEVIMTGAETKEANSKNTKSETLTYMGNIRCNRYLSLFEIGKTIDKINIQNGTDYQLHIYSPEKDEDILNTLKQAKSIQFKGFVSGEEFKKVFRESEILLHTEAFDEESRDMVKHSVSTKIADSLASGIPLIAYGPEEISSMQHLIRNDCAYIATSPEQLEMMLLKAFNGEDTKRIVANAVKTAKEYHDSEKNSKKLREIFENLDKTSVNEEAYT